MWMFIGIVGFLATIMFLILGIVFAIKKNGKAKKAFFSALIAFVVFIAGLSFDDTEPTSKTASNDNVKGSEVKNDDTTKKKDDSETAKNEETKKEENPKEKSKEKPKLTIKTAALDSKDFSSLVKKINKDIDKVEVNATDIKVTFKDDISYWDVIDILKQTAIDGIKIMEKVFSNEKVTSVTIYVPGSMVDEKGNESIETLVEVKWNRELSNEVNYENFGDMVLVKFPRFYNVSTSYSIHPGVFKAIEDKYKEQFETGLMKME